MQNVTTRVAQIFWGLVIIAVDLRAGRFDVLPDFIGYILVALGAAGLVGWSRQFQTARTFSWVLVAFPILLFFIHSSIARFIWMANLVLDGALMWFLLGGIMEFSQNRTRVEWSSRASFARRAYIALLAVSLVTGWIATAVPTISRVLGWVTFVAMTVLVAAILYLVHQVKGEAAKTEPEVANANPNANADQNTNGNANANANVEVKPAETGATGSSDEVKKAA